MPVETNTEEDQMLRPNPYLGFWGTVSLGVLTFIIFSLLQAIIFLAYTLYQQGFDLDNIESILQSSMLNGDAIAFSEIPSAIIGIILVVTFSAIKGTLRVKDYLLLNPPKFPDILKWLGIMVLLIIATEAVNIVLERETPDFMTDVYKSTNNFALLWIAVIVAAPIFEEFLFRGFIFEGLRHSKLGLIGAILVTASSWAIIHSQYGWFEIVTIFIIGIVLAIAKYKTKSLYIPIAMHMLMNLTASVMMEVQKNTAL